MKQITEDYLLTGLYVISIVLMSILILCLAIAISIGGIGGK